MARNGWFRSSGRGSAFLGLNSHVKGRRRLVGD
jgi:hypothetical protein